MEEILRLSIKPQYMILHFCTETKEGNVIVVAFLIRASISNYSTSVLYSSKLKLYSTSDSKLG